MTRNELIIKLAVASYPAFFNATKPIPREDWIGDALVSADALLAALDKESPPGFRDINDVVEELERDPARKECLAEARRKLAPFVSKPGDETYERLMRGEGPTTAAPAGEPTNRDKALAGEVIKVSDKRLEEMQRQAVQFEGIDTGHMHWHWAAAVNELIDLRKGGEPKERVCRWTVTNHTVGSGIYERRLYVTGCEDKRHESRETGADFCKYCGGKIITEAT